MRILLIGATGQIGSAVHQRLRQSHEVLTATRSTGLFVDILDPDSVRRLYERVGTIDAVITAVGFAPMKPLTDLERADYLAAFTDKALSQVEIVRQGIPFVR